MKFLIMDFFSKCDQIWGKLRIWPHFLKKSVMENFIFLYSEGRKQGFFKQFQFWSNFFSWFCSLTVAGKLPLHSAILMKAIKMLPVSPNREKSWIMSLLKNSALIWYRHFLTLCFLLQITIAKIGEKSPFKMC